jgi:hypothetical protein
MQQKLKSTEKFTDHNRDYDYVWLLKTIKGIMHNFDEQVPLFLSLIDASVGYLTFKQTKDMSLMDYQDHFIERVTVFEHYGGNIGQDPSLLTLARKISNSLDPKEIARYARDRTLAMLFLRNSDMTRFEAVWFGLANQYSGGTDQYPLDITSAYNLLENYKPRTRQHQNPRRPPVTPTAVVPTDDGLTFVQTEGFTPGNDGITHSHVRCYNCQRYGHYAGPACPSTADSGVTMLQVQHPEDHEYSLTQYNHSDNQRVFLPDNWILLDSCSTISIFRTRGFLRNIRKSPRPMRVLTNGGIQISTLIGDVKEFGTIWYNPKSLGNILSLAAVMDTCRVTLDSQVEQSISVHRLDGTLMTFHRYGPGLFRYIHDEKTTRPPIPPEWNLEREPATPPPPVLS